MNIFKCSFCCRKENSNGEEVNDEDLSEIEALSQIEAGDTSIVDSVICGQLDVVKEKVRRGANINILDYNGYKPIHRAAWYGHLDIMKFLIEKGALHDEPNQTDLNTPLGLSAYKNHPDIISFLIDLGCNLNNGDHELDTALHYCSFNGMTDSVQLLIASGADPNVRNTANVTPLWYAVKQQLKLIVKILLDVQPDLEVETRGNDQRTYYHLRVDPYPVPVSPLYVAVDNLDLDTVGLLIDAGYNLKEEEWILNDKFPENARDNTELVHFLKEQASSPSPLKALCRNFIRSNFRMKIRQKVMLLDIPKALKKYLLLDDVNV